MSDMLSLRKFIRQNLHSCTIEQDYKYMYWPNFKYEQLFDLNEDPGEMNDLFQSTNPEHKAKLNEMRKRFTELKKIVKGDELVTL